MGLQCSKLSDLDSNDFLVKFCSKERLTPNDPIWNNLFSHSLPPVFTRDENFLLDSSLEKHRHDLLINNVKTKNFASLVKVFILRSNELRSSVQTCDSLFIWQAYNALFMIRTIVKYFVENLNDAACLKQFERNWEDDEALGEGLLLNEEPHVLGDLLSALTRIIIQIPVKSNTYLLHVEAVNSLILLMSIQMFWSIPAENFFTYRILMNSSRKMENVRLVKCLLRNYIHSRVPPHSVMEREEGGSIVIGVASGLWQILRKGVGLKGDVSQENLKVYNLGRKSIQLLLVLINHCTGTNEISNPYRTPLNCFLNEPAGSENGECEEESRFGISYSKLYETICEEISSDESTLLLYTLLHRNETFKAYIMARTDIENLVIPILKTLYNAPSSTSHHIYMSLIVMLILSEDQLFNQQVHDITIKNTSWYTERSLSEISLGGLIILVVIRTIQYNISKMRDKYLHTNCLAALANMSWKFRNVHPYVAQRLVSLFEALSKRHHKLVWGLNVRLESNSPPTREKDEEMSEMEQDINVLEEVIRMVLEILNSTLTHQLPANRHLVYTLLYKRHVFDSIREYTAIQDLVYNLDIVISYFTKKLGDDQRDLNAKEVMGRIEEGVLHWSPDILKKFPALKFRYVEEEQPEDFFIPYIWSVIYRHCGLYWSPLNLTLFSPHTDFVMC